MNTATVIAAKNDRNAIRSIIPAHLRSAFGLRPGAHGATIVDYMITHASSEQRRNDCYDARKALEGAGYRIAESYGALTVFPPLPEPEHCDGCHAPNVRACRCKDLVTE
jgi:hypothetical protein